MIICLESMSDWEKRLSETLLISPLRARLCGTRFFTKVAPAEIAHVRALVINFDRFYKTNHDLEYRFTLQDTAQLDEFIRRFQTDLRSNGWMTGSHWGWKIDISAASSEVQDG